MSGIDWARLAERGLWPQGLWPLEKACKLVCGEGPTMRTRPEDISNPGSPGCPAWVNLFHMAYDAVITGTLQPGKLLTYLDGTIVIWVRLAVFFPWARKNGYPLPEELEEVVNRFQPKAEGTPQAGAENSDLTRQNETPTERHARIAARHEELKAGGSRCPTKTVAAEEDISENWVRQLIRTARKESLKPTIQFRPRPVPKAR